MTSLNHYTLASMRGVPGRHKQERKRKKDKKDAAPIRGMSCDKCGSTIRSAESIVWHWWPDAHLKTQADGIYCSQSCCTKDTDKARSERRAYAKQLESLMTERDRFSKFA